jgi:peptide/nickel transport system permease protein
LLKRLFGAALTLLTVVTAIFFLTRLSGSPAELLLPPNATNADIVQLSRTLGLDDPIPIQYARYLIHLSQGDLGTSYSFRAPVRDLILQAFPYSAELGIAAFVFASVIGLTLGTLSALNVGTMLDAGAKGFAVLGQSVPSFWLGMVLVYVFTIKLGLLPAFGSGQLDHLILPAVSLGAYSLAVITRLTRSATLEVLRTEHALFERSKGVRPRVFVSHVLKNAALPVITLSGVQLGALISGTVIIETLFAWPGLGQLAIQAIQNRDYTVVQGVVLVETAIFVLLNLLVDLSYGWLDPRVRR